MLDRTGITHLPFDEAFELARRFCAAEPATVLVGIEATERDWTHKAGERGGEYILSLLNEYRASWALIRQWTGQEQRWRKEKRRFKGSIERLVWDAAYALQKAGLDSESARLRRAIEKH